MVYTKGDKCDKGFANQFAENELELQLGRFVVVNRSAEDFENGMTLAEVRKKEAIIMKERDGLSKLPSANKGTPNLVSRLIQV